MTRFAPTLANEYAYATEISLATLSGLLMRKSSAKCEIQRQTNICLRQLQVCLAHKTEIDWGSEWRKDFGRVEELLDAAAKSNLNTALEAWVADHVRPRPARAS